MVTDAGSDESKMRRLAKESVRLNEAPGVYFFDCDCLHHQHQLIKGAMLQRGSELLRLWESAI
eukprot:1710811-Pyramimonas_sp.AAC.1